MASVEKMITQTDNIGRSLCGCAKIVFIVNSAVQNIYSSLFVKKNDSIEKIKKNVTKLQKKQIKKLK